MAKQEPPQCLPAHQTQGRIQPVEGDDPLLRLSLRQFDVKTRGGLQIEKIEDLGDDVIGVAEVPIRADTQRSGNNGVRNQTSEDGDDIGAELVKVPLLQSTLFTRCHALAPLRRRWNE